MPPLRERLAALALAAVVPALPAPASGDTEPAPWYRVELLVFRYTDPAALNAEAWPVYPETAYPARYRFLVDRALADRRLAAHPEAESRIDELGRQRLRLPPPTVAADADGPPPVVPDLLPLLPLEPERPDGHVGTAGPQALNQAPAASEPGTPEPGTPNPNAPGTAPGPGAPPPLPPAFTALDARTLPAGRLVGDYEVLWHEAWLQPLRGEADAVPLLLDRSGDPDREPWPRLQGSVRLYLSRYLHLETALWLNTDGSYLPGGWQADAPPLAPPSLAINPAPPPQRDPARALLDGEPRRPDARLADGTLAWDGPRRVSAAPPIADESSTGKRLPQDPDAPEDPNARDSWPWRHSIVLAAERRMRSGETHYLDHPLFGVVVRLEPLEPEALETLGEELADPAWDARHGRAARPGDAP